MEWLSFAFFHTLEKKEVCLMQRIKMNNVEKGVTFEKAFNEFLRDCKITNLSEETIIYYKRCAKNFCRYFDENNFCSEITEETYKSFIEFLKNSGEMKDITINTNLRGIKVILNFFMNKNYTEHFDMSLMKIDKVIKETYTDKELEVLLKKPNFKECSFAELRSWALENFFMGTGQRISATLNIKVGDISLEEREIIIRKTKGRRQQIIPISPYLCKVLSDYLRYRGMDDPEGYLFCNQFGSHLSRSGAEDAIADYNRARGVEKRSIHIFRHTFAKKWIMSGGDIFSLQKMLGHSSLEMVKEYVEIFGTDLQKLYDQHNPLENFKSCEYQKVLKRKRT